jgi:alpha-methylacyl-CoA racemase
MTEPALAAITVLDFSTVGPAARCARILADYGASVVKIGAPPRRVAQQPPSARQAPRASPDASGVQIEPPYHSYAANRGMKRIRIDLKAPEGRAAFLRLAERADVVIESFRPGVADRLGVGYEDVRRANQRVVYCSTSGYGQHGPHSRWAGHDINYLAVAGYLDCSGRRADGGPALPGASLADGAGGGMHAAIAILAALLRRARTGRGEYLDVSVADGVLSLMSLYVDQYLATGERPGPGHDILTGRYACYDVYRARDGKWLAVGAIEPAFFANLCRALGLERWIPHQTDAACQEEIREALGEAFARRDRDEWVAELAPANTCVAPIYSIPELVEDPQFASRRAFAEAVHESRGRFRQVAPVLAGQTRGEEPHPVGEATDAETLLREVGLTEERIEALRSEGVVA